MKKIQTSFSDLFRRVIVHAISITMLLLFLRNATYVAGAWFMGFLVAVLGALGANEFYILARLKSAQPKKIWGVVATFGFLIFSFLNLRFPDYFPGDIGKNLPWILLTIWTGCLIFSFKNLTSSPVINTGVTLFGLLYVGFPLKLFLEILYGFSYPNWPSLGLWLTSFLICVTKSTDVFGYFFGKAFGKTKITPLISPKKTVVGLISGLIGSGLVAALFSTALSHYHRPLHARETALIITAGLLLGFVGFLGDLSESLFKRDSSVKDSYSFPSVGGILDNLDSLLFSTPVFYLLLKICELTGHL